MKINFQKKPIVQFLVLLSVLALVISFLSISAQTANAIIEKRRLLNGVQIVATVKNTDSHLNIVREGLRTHTIDYEFQYTDRQTGELKRQVQTGYEVYHHELRAYAPGSTFTATFLPTEPTVRQPTVSVGRFDPQTVLHIRLATSILLVGILAALVIKLYGWIDQRFGSQKIVGIVGVFSVATVAGFALGKYVSYMFEHFLL